MYAETSVMNMPRCVWWLFAGTLLNRLGTLVPAFIALYLQLQKGTPENLIGVLIGVWGAGATIGALIGGALSDRVGPRRAIVSAQIITLVSCVGVFFSHSSISLLPFLFSLGLASSFARPVAASIISSELPSVLHVKAFGIVYWASNIGSAFSFVVGGVLIDFSPELLLVFNATTASCYLFISFRLPEPYRSHKAYDTWSGVVKKTFAPFLKPNVLAFLFLMFLLSLIYLQKQSSLPIDMAEKGMSPTALGLVLSLNGILIVFFQPFVSSCTEKIGEKFCFVFSALFLGVGFGTNFLSETWLEFSISLVIWTFGEMLLIPQVSSFLLNVAPEGSHGTYQGAFYFVWSLGLALGAPFGLMLLHNYGANYVWLSCLVSGFFVSMVFLFLFRKLKSGR